MLYWPCVIIHSPSNLPGAVSAMVPINLWTKFGHACCLADCWFDDKPSDWNLWLLLIHLHFGLFLLLCLLSFAHNIYFHPENTREQNKVCCQISSPTNQPTQLLPEASFSSDPRDRSLRDFLQRWFPTGCWVPTGAWSWTRQKSNSYFESDLILI